jgi:hypothetical protein
MPLSNVKVVLLNGRHPVDVWLESGKFAKLRDRIIVHSPTTVQLRLDNGLTTPVLTSPYAQTNSKACNDQLRNLLRSFDLHNTSDGGVGLEKSTPERYVYSSSYFRPAMLTAH